MNLKKANLIPADGLLMLAAHISRAKTFTEWLDPAVLDEKDPSARDSTLDIFDSRSAESPRPPFSPAFVERYRSAQVARNRRIATYCKERLREIESDLQDPKKQQSYLRCKRDEVFSVQCTQADIRRLSLQGMISLLVVCSTFQGHASRSF